MVRYVSIRLVLAGYLLCWLDGLSINVLCFCLCMADTLRRRAWPKLVGLHERLWEDVTRRDGKHVTFGYVETRERSESDLSVSSSRSATKPPGMPSSPLRLGRSQRGFRRSISCNSSSADEGSAASASSLRDTIMAKSIDFSQIELDVARCTWHLLTGGQRVVSLQMEHKRHRKVARLIRRKQRRLANLINITLVQSYKKISPDSTGSNHYGIMETDNTLRYYQGYHDVACIILSTLSGSSPVRLRPSDKWFQSMEGMAVATGLDMPAAVLLQVSQSHLRDCMRANFLQLQTCIRLTIFPLIAYFDRPVHEFLESCEMEPFFALSWVITWFSHEIRDTDLVKRLFDFFLVSHPLMPIYVAVAMVCHPLNRQDILHADCDFAAVHQALAALPKNCSMVGWKYRPGDGYVSDDEDDVDDEISTGMLDSQSSVDTDFLLHEEALQSIRGKQGVTTAEAVSTVSSAVSSMNEARVPFQEILDHAVSYMDRLPPRRILDLATRYYGRDEVDAMMDAAPGIHCFQDPPAWSKAPHAKADWALRQQDRQDRGLGPSRKDKKLVERLNSQEINSRTMLDVTVKEDRLRIEKDDWCKALAVVAAGYGAGDEIGRRRRRRQRRMFLGALALAVLAISVGLVLQNRREAVIAPDLVLPSIDLVATTVGLVVEEKNDTHVDSDSHVPDVSTEKAEEETLPEKQEPMARRLAVSAVRALQGIAMYPLLRTITIAESFHDHVESYTEFKQRQLEKRARQLEKEPQEL